MNRFTKARQRPLDTPCQGLSRSQDDKGCPVTAKTIDQIRFLMTIIMMITIAAAMGIAPSLWAAL